LIIFPPNIEAAVRPLLFCRNALVLSCESPNTSALGDKQILAAPAAFWSLSDPWLLSLVEQPAHL
jgi:hypothetical protein